MNWTGLRRASLTASFLLAFPALAVADNCGGLADCYGTAIAAAKVAAAIAVAIGIWAVLPEILTAAAIGAADSVTQALTGVEQEPTIRAMTPEELAEYNRIPSNTTRIRQILWQEADAFEHAAPDPGDLVDMASDAIGALDPLPKPGVPSSMGVVEHNANIPFVQQLKADIEHDATVPSETPLQGDSSENDVPSTPQQTDPEAWRTYVTDQLNNVQASMPSDTPCNLFCAQAVQSIYNLQPFGDPAAPMTANQIADFAEAHPEDWQVLDAADQESLKLAQEYANSGSPVIAVWSNPDPQQSGHAALIVPGDLTSSGTWGLDVPNSASNSLDNPQLNYINGRLSQAFGPDKKDDVAIYVLRNFPRER